MRPAPSSNHRISVAAAQGQLETRSQSNSKPPAPSCVNEPSKLDPCPSVCYLHVLTKAQGKGTCALPKNLRRLLITSWQRKDVWKTLFQNKSSGTINPAYLPLELLNNTKTVSMKKHCLSQLMPKILSCSFEGTSH